VNALINRFATPLITGLFLVSAISGIALFFSWQPGAFHGMHEWLSMVLLIPFVAHVWKNWRPLMSYLNRHLLILPVAACLVVAIAFAIPAMTGTQGGNPAFRALPLLTQAKLTDLAPLLKTTPATLVATLSAKGYKNVTADQTLTTIATTAGGQPNMLLFSLIPAN
jgi:hypothetical protein